MAILSFQKPDKVFMIEADDFRGTFEFRPLEPGYGITIGNALRRVLLSSLEGFAITSVRIDGVDHEFSSLPGVVEDMTDIILKLKQIRFRRQIEDFDNEKVAFSLIGQTVFKAGDLNSYLNGFQVLNPDLEICHMESTTELKIELTIEKGRGYVPADENKKPGDAIGVIAIDSIHTPIINVKYEVSDYRVEQRTDYEKLTFDIETDGSIHPKAGGGSYNYGQSCTVSASASTGYTFTNWTENGTQVSTNPNYTFTVTGNRTLVAQFNYSGGGNVPQGAINGLFTINSNGDQVYFSKGNLQYIGSASTPYWKFADNQWECLGNNGQGSTNQNVDRDLFGWGTSGWNCGNTYYRPWDTDNSNGTLYGPPGQYNLTGTYANSDWGVYNTVYSGNTQTTGWRTLTGGGSGDPNNEWYYVFFTRNASTVNGEPNARYAKAKVANVQGVILFPDVYVHPTGVAQPTGINETGNTGWNGNNYTATEFGLMQEAGAVFLPAAGYRIGTSVYNVGSYGYYWSATYSYSNNARLVGFHDGHLYAGYDNYSRYYGFSVRLVRSAQ